MDLVESDSELVLIMAILELFHARLMFSATFISLDGLRVLVL